MKINFTVKWAAWLLLGAFISLTAQDKKEPEKKTEDKSEKKEAKSERRKDEIDLLLKRVRDLQAAIQSLANEESAARRASSGKKEKEGEKKPIKLPLIEREDSFSGKTTIDQVELKFNGDSLSDITFTYQVYNASHELAIERILRGNGGSESAISMSYLEPPYADQNENLSDMKNPDDKVALLQIYCNYLVQVEKYLASVQKKREIMKRKGLRAYRL